ncbi:hypothetical protein HDU96_006425 [Phlyctochytrium bullatum]|nr:hypothetical protein HDU96_006425 [Phlyctochytrium bullatum]
MLSPLAFITALVGAASADRVYLSVWHEQGDPTPSDRYLVRDYPVNVNTRLGRNVAAYQFAQELPLRTIDGSGGLEATGNVTALEETNTDAFMVLTVYPRNDYDRNVAVSGFDAITDESVNRLADQLYNLTAPDRSNRRVFLRLFPEMNGNWYARWHRRPVEYRRQWIRIWNAVSRRGAKDRVAFVWAPNYRENYPYGGSDTITGPTGSYPNATEWDALDTSGEGDLSPLDSAFSPWYPGDQYVDWVGLSVYFKNNGANSPPPAGAFDSYMEGNRENFYELYARQKNKPFMITESGAGFNIDDLRSGTPVPVATSGASQLAVQQPFWQQYITSEAALRKYPLMKMITLFEHRKLDDEHGREFRVLADASVQGDQAVLDAFKADLEAVAARYVWANRTDRAATTVSATTTTTTAVSTTVARTASTTSVSVPVTLTGVSTTTGVPASTTLSRSHALPAAAASSVGVVVAGILALMFQ